MKILGFTEARQNLAKTFDSVVDDAEEVVIHRTGDERSVVIVSLSEWNSIKETDYLMSNPVMAARLRRGIANLNAGRGEEHSLDEMEAVARTSEVA